MPGFFTSIWDRFLNLVSPLKTSLPQESSKFAQRQRTRQLASAQDTYQFSYTHVSSLAIVDKLPIWDELNFHWLAIVLEKVLVALENRASLEFSAEDAKVHHEKHGKLRSLKERGLEAVAEMRELIHEALRFDIRIGAAANPATSLQEYDNLFRSIGLPPISKDFRNDLAFADMHIAGPNPAMIQRMTALDDRLPITNPLFQVAAPDDSLEAALAEARLYVTDYAILDGAECSSFPNGQKYLAAPIALFVVDKTTKQLKPVAIQCRQKPGPDNPIFTPGDGWNWQIAKTFVEIADGNVHEAMMHLGRTHLTMEPFAVSTLRQLALSSGEPAIAASFRGDDVDQPGIVEAPGGRQGRRREALQRSIENARGLAIKGVQTLDVMNSMLPQTFAQRGVDDAAACRIIPIATMLCFTGKRSTTGSRTMYRSTTIPKPTWSRTRSCRPGRANWLPRMAAGCTAFPTPAPSRPSTS